MIDKKQNSEQRARDQIDGLLKAAGWLVWENNVGPGIADRQYRTDISLLKRKAVFKNEGAAGSQQERS